MGQEETLSQMVSVGVLASLNSVHFGFESLEREKYSRLVLVLSGVYS